MDKQVKASRIASVIIFLALIRCIAEPFRLQYYSATPLSFENIKPFIIGALAAASGLFIMTVLSFWKFYGIVLAVACLTLISLFVVKYIYLS